MSVRYEVVKGQSGYQLVQVSREGQRERTRVVVRLGRHATVQDALKHFRRRLREYRRSLAIHESSKELDPKRYERVQRQVEQAEDTVKRLTLVARLLTTKES